MTRAVAQGEHGGHAGDTTHAGHEVSIGVAAQAIPLLTRATPTAGARSLSEAYVSQPIVSAHATAFGGRLSALGMLNLEGATLARGELDTGTYGESYVDRRHPHTYVHELVATAMQTFAIASRAAGFSVTAGRGFAPFGSDDPMTRPFEKYPVNHHLAQILERVIVVAAARTGPLVLEGAVFNGDEPLTPRSAPLWRRFGDSWSARVTVRPLSGLEMSASTARVVSPEFREGLGLDQRKGSAVLRFEQNAAGGGASRYLLAEWARTSEYRGERRVFTYESYLSEGAYCRRGYRGALRLERTVRPEE
jgi:hypothetical protein